MSSVIGTVAGVVVGRFATPNGPRLHVCTVALDGEPLTAEEARALAKLLEQGAIELEQLRERGD